LTFLANAAGNGNSGVKEKDFRKFRLTADLSDLADFDTLGIKRNDEA
jgi:hypothetical protein